MYFLKALVDKDVRKTFADSVLPYFESFHAISSTSGRDGMFTKSSQRDTLRQMCSCKINEISNVERFLLQIEKIPAKLVRPWVQNVLRKIDEANPAGYTHGKDAQRSTQNEVAGLHLPCRSPVVMEPTEFLEIAENRGVFWVFLGTRKFLHRKCRCGNEWKNVFLIWTKNWIWFRFTHFFLNIWLSSYLIGIH